MTQQRLFTRTTLFFFGTLLWLLLSACGSDAASVTTAEPGTDSDVVEPVDTSEEAPPEDVPAEDVPAEEPAPAEPQADPLELAADDIVFVWAEDGGCFQAGANCARYEITADGTVTTFRVGQEDAEPDNQGTVSTDLVDAWIDAVNDTDVAALLTRVGPGEMTAAFDGIDYLVTAPFAGLELSSVTNDFARSEPFFAAAFALATASFESAPLAIEFR